MNKILISACLMGDNVRYDGRSNPINHSLIEKLDAAGRLVKVCPELLGGLSVPRAYAEIKQRIPMQVITVDGDDVTPQFLLGAELAVEEAQRQGCTVALLKSGSPACGSRNISGAAFSGKPSDGAGIAAQELIQSGIPVYDETQLDELAEILNQLDFVAESA